MSQDEELYEHREPVQPPIAPPYSFRQILANYNAEQQFVGGENNNTTSTSKSTLPTINHIFSYDANESRYEDLIKKTTKLRSEISDGNAEARAVNNLLLNENNTMSSSLNRETELDFLCEDEIPSVEFVEELLAQMNIEKNQENYRVLLDKLTSADKQSTCVCKSPLQ